MRINSDALSLGSIKAQPGSSFLGNTYEECSMITSVEEYVSLVEHDDNDVRQTAVSDEADALTWHAILENRPDLSSEVAMNKKLPSEIIDRLITNECCRTRSLVALKRALSHEQFLKLANDEDESVRAMIANNKKTPLKILERLVHDEFEIVSEAAKTQVACRGDTE